MRPSFSIGVPFFRRDRVLAARAVILVLYVLNKGRVSGFIAQIALTFETNQKDDRPCALQ